jgi:hypothetical protein
MFPEFVSMKRELKGIHLALQGSPERGGCINEKRIERSPGFMKIVRLSAGYQ